MSRVERSRREKVTRYSVRKVSFGAASVAVAAFFMFLGNGAVYAAEPNVTATDSALAATPANNQLDENSGSSEATAPKAQADTTTPAPADASSTSVESSTVSKAQADTTTSKPADATPAPVVSSTTSATEETAEKATPALDKKQLEDYVAEIDAKLASGSYANKTDESVATLKEHLGLAKLALTTAQSQDELTKAYRRLFMTVNSGLRSKPKAQVESPKLDTTEGKATVGKKASNTEKATGTNSIANSGKHDPRNGQALDANNPFRTGDTDTTDEDDPSVNAKNVEVVNPYFEANGTPTKAEKFKVIDSFDLIGWKLTNPNQTKVVIANGKASSYGGYGSVVDQTHPYGIPLALYTVKNDPNSKSDKFGGVYQDIDVKPGQEIVIGQNTTSYGGFGTQNNRTKLTVSYPEKGNQEQGNLIWRPLVSPYSGVFTVPKGVTKIRVRLEAGPNNISQDDSSKIEIDGQTYYVGAMVSKLSITTGANVVAKTPTVTYNEVSPSATATTVRATISVDLVNEGHAYSANNIYSVKLPDNATYVSSEGGTSANVNDGTLRINYKSLAPGETKTLTYTVDLPADKASSTDFNGISTWKTNTAFNGLEGTVVGGTVIGTPGAKIRNIPVKPQNVTVSMYKTDLENKVNELETQLAQLNQADYTPESWKAMQDQLAEAKNILNEEKNNVPVADRKNQSEINTKLVLLEKEKAKLDLEKAAKDQIAAIEAVDGSVKEEKEAAKAKVIEALAASKKAVDSATTEADVAAKLTEETNKITPILPAEEVKTAAKNDIQSVLEEKKSQIAARDDLTTEEKEAAVKEAERLAQDAKNRVDAATTEESVERNKDRGVEKVEKVDPVAKAKPAAKAAIDAALKAQEQAIDAKPDSTKEEKEAAKEEARAKAETAKAAIDKATSNADVTAAKEAGVGTITPVEPKAEVKPAAKQAIEDAYTAKVAEIEKRPDLTTEEKEAAKAEARKLADAAKVNVDKAKTDAGVAVVEQQGTTNVADVDPVAKAKPAAKAAIDAALKAQEKAIDAKPDSTKEEKEAAKEEARAKAEAAKTAIDKATSNADVTAAKEAGVGTITPVEPKAEVKPAAKQAIEDAYTAKVAEIEKRPELTTEEKEAAKAEARKLADAAKANVDKAKTDDAVAAAEDKGTTKVADVDPAAKAKPAAKAAVDAALAEKDKAIDANDKPSDAEKSAAKEEAKKAADEAKKAIDAATDQAGVDAKATEGTEAVAAVNPVGKDKAKAAVDAALAEKDKAIDANDKLSDAEKSAAKEEAKKAADEAKKAIDAATDQAGVDAKATEGTDAVAAVNPVGKDKAKAAVDAALAEKEKAIDANDKLSDAEKLAAKEEAKAAADEAKKAIDAAADQAGVDAKEAEGKAEIAKVTPAAAVEVGKSAAKAEIEKAAKAKEAAIEANDKLSEAAKAAAKAQVAAEAKKAIEAIEKAATEADVEVAKEAGKAEIAKVAPATTDYKAKAKAEVEAELAKKLAELENATDLTEAEKAAAKAQVVNKAKEAIEAIQKAATEADVDQAIRNFVYRISAVIREQEEYDLSKLFVNGSVTVKQGESLTDKDVLSKLNLPSGVEIVKVEKPTTSALGTVMAKVTVKLADGSVEEINVPVEVIVSQNHGNEGNEGNGANNGANNTEAKVNKAKLEGAIHQLDELIIKESAKLDVETAKEANTLLSDAKKVFANADATQAEVDAMVKRIEDFMAKVAPSTDHANTSNDQSAQTPAVVPANNQSAQTTVVAPATTQAAANASQTASAQANARKAAKELPNTGTADSTVAMVAAAASALLGLGLAGRRRKEDEEA